MELKTNIISRDQMNRFVKNLIDSWNDHDVEKLAEFYAADYRGNDIADSRPQEGLAAIQSAARRYFLAFPDLHFRKENLLIEENQAVLIWIATGTHRGPLLNIPPSGRQFSVRGMSFYSVIDERIKSGSNIWDLAGFLRNIGLLPEL
ncbi:MAG: ester cyclase [Calditrichia bacterium]